MPSHDAPLIIASAPNGAYKKKSDHAALPVTTDEIIQTAADIADAGAAMLHLHVRDAGGKHTLNTTTYRKTIERINEYADNRLFIQVTSEAAGVYSAEQQIAAIKSLKPEAVSLAIAELIPDDSQLKSAKEYFHWLMGENIISQFILYSAQHVNWYLELCDSGVIPDGPKSALFVLGRYKTGAQSIPTDLLPFLEQWNKNEAWMVCAFGAGENACTITAAALGGHARIGFENNLYLSSGDLAENNQQLIGQATEAARLLNRPLANATQARAILSGNF